MRVFTYRVHKNTVTREWSCTVWRNGYVHESTVHDSWMRAYAYGLSHGWTFVPTV